MKAAGMKISFKSPIKQVADSNASPYQINRVIKEADRNVASLFVRQIQEAAAKSADRNSEIIAILFQRVCSRTPLDEEYKIMTVNRNTGEYSWREHIPDEDRCRYDWYITDGEKKVYAGDMAERNSGIFDSYNNRESIRQIKEIIREQFDFMSDASRFTIGNANGHFAYLEYGNSAWKKDSEHPNEGKLYEHGVKSRHSVQAPVGMLRITRMELGKIIQDVSSGKTKGSVYKSYRLRGSQKIPTGEQLDNLVSSFKANRTLRLSDIKRYVKLYD